jgi:hypothetical protein
VPQKIGVVEYVGSPYHVHFGDRFTPRVLLLDANGGRTNLRFPCLERFVADVSDPEEIRNLKCKPKDQIKIRLKIKQRDVGEWPILKKKSLAICKELELEVRGVEPNIERVVTKRVQLKELTPPSEIKKASLAPPDTVRAYAADHQLGQELVETGLRLVQ